MHKINQSDSKYTKDFFQINTVLFNLLFIKKIQIFFPEMYIEGGGGGGGISPDLQSNDCWKCNCHHTELYLKFK